MLLSLLHVPWVLLVPEASAGHGCSATTAMHAMHQSEHRLAKFSIQGSCGDCTTWILWQASVLGFVVQSASCSGRGQYASAQLVKEAVRGQMQAVQQNASRARQRSLKLAKLAE